MSYPRTVRLFELGWMLASRYQQMRAWDDAEQARQARARAEAQAVVQFQTMLDANPSGQLGNARLNDPQALKESGLLWQWRT